METRSYVVEQHFGSELVAIAVEIGFMEARLKQKMKERNAGFLSQKEHLLLVLYFLPKWWRGKLKENSINCLDETQSTIHLCDPTHRCVTRQEITVFSPLSKVL